MWDALMIIYPDGGIYFETYRGVSETRGIHYGGGNKTLFKFSAWNHVVITFSKSEDKVEIYVNGVEIEGSAGHGANSPSLANSNIPLTIGRYPTNSTNLSGYIQNFRISKKKVYTMFCFTTVILHRCVIQLQLLLQSNLHRHQLKKN